MSEKKQRQQQQQEEKNMWQTSERMNATNECASHRRTNSTAKSQFINRNVFVCAMRIEMCDQIVCKDKMMLQ